MAKVPTEARVISASDECVSVEVSHDYTATANSIARAANKCMRATQHPAGQWYRRRTGVAQIDPGAPKAGVEFISRVQFDRVHKD